MMPMSIGFVVNDTSLSALGFFLLDFVSSCAHSPILFDSVPFPLLESFARLKRSRLIRALVPISWISSAESQTTPPEPTMKSLLTNANITRLRMDHHRIMPARGSIDRNLQVFFRHFLPQ
jgi:hypothetical protein